MSWPPGHVLFSWDASSSPTLKARMHETEPGLPCQRGVCFGRNSPSISVQEGDSGAAQPGLLDGAWKAPARSSRLGECAESRQHPKKNPKNTWGGGQSLKFPVVFPCSASIRARFHQPQGRSCRGIKGLCQRLYPQPCHPLCFGHHSTTVSRDPQSPGCV